MRRATDDLDEVETPQRKAPKKGRSRGEARANTIRVHAHKRRARSLARQRQNKHMRDHEYQIKRHRPTGSRRLAQVFV